MNNRDHEDQDELSWIAAREALRHAPLTGTWPHVSPNERAFDRMSLTVGGLFNALSSQSVLTERAHGSPWATLMDSANGRLRISADLVALVAEREGSHASEITTAPAIQQVVLRAVEALTDSRRLGEEVKVLDVACGSGLLLARVADHLQQVTGRPVAAYGSDISSDVIFLAKKGFEVAGRQAALMACDVLEEDAFPDLKADYVVSDLPLSITAQNKSQGADSRFPLGIPRGDASLAFVQAMLSKLRSPDQGGGIAVALVSNTALQATDAVSAQFRTAITDEDILRAVVLLPERLMKTTGVAVNLLVFDNAKPKAWQGKVQFIDLRSQFIDSDQLSGRRVISAEGLKELQRALRKPKPSRHVRTVPGHLLRFRNVRLGLTARSGSRAPSERTFTVRIPSNVEPSEWCAQRYVNSGQFHIHAPSGSFASWDPGSVFRDAQLDKALRAQKERWPFWSLAGLVSDFRLLPSHRSKERAGDDTYRMEADRTLVLPLAHAGESRLLELHDDLPTEQALLIQCEPLIDAEFLAGWLNTDAGRTARRSAENSSRLIRAVRSDSDALQYLDRLGVPLPALSDQRAIASALGTLGAARSDLDDLRLQLWDTPEVSLDIRDEVAVWLNRAERLDSWIDSLPFPIASSLWTYVSSPNDKEAVEQLFHVFEAFSQFHATYMIAALRQDLSLWKVLVPRLREQHKSYGLSFATATFATWRTTSELLAAEFRRGLFGDDTEQAGRYLSLLGDPNSVGIRRLLSSELLQVLAKANTLRNNWHGHSGAVSQLEAASRHERLREHLVELRTALGNGWGGLQLIRAGSATYDGSTYHYHVELLQGVRTPFEPSYFDTDRRDLVSGGLYLISQSGGSVEIPGFVRMGPDPEAAENTCYFYNRLQDSGTVRVVTYQRAQFGELDRNDDQISRLVAELDA